MSNLTDALEKDLDILTKKEEALTLQIENHKKALSSMQTDLAVIQIKKNAIQGELDSVKMPAALYWVRHNTDDGFYEVVEAATGAVVQDELNRQEAIDAAEYWSKQDGLL